MKRLLAAATVALCVADASAATFTVTNTNDSGAGSLRDAIVQANANPGADTINFSVTGTIVLTSGQIKISEALTIAGPGANNLTIDGNANSRIFSIFLTDPACPTLDGSDYLVSISGLRLTNALNTFVNTGGAIFSEHSVALDSMVIQANTSRQGAGIGVLVQYPAQTLTITNSRFINNFTVPVPVTGTTTLAPQQGTGVYLVERCSGTRTAPVTVAIANSVFSGNRSQPTTLHGRGPALTTFSYADITITDTRMVDNHVDVPNPPASGQIYRGGAIYGYAKSLKIERSEIAENTIIDATVSDQSRGGGIALINDILDLQDPSAAMTVQIINSTISGNVVPATAGAMWIYGNIAVELDNSTISDNVAANNRTGGILITTGATSPPGASNAAPPTLKMVSSILANSNATTADLATNTTTVPSFTVDATNSLIESICSTCSISVSGTGNLTAVDPKLGPLAFNGGSSRTHAPLSGSPVINAGSNPLNLTTDQRGIGFPRVRGPAADMGAYESVGDLAFAPITPCRLADTRNAGGALAPRAARSFWATDATHIGQAGGNPSGCSVPVGPAALALTITVVQPPQVGNLIAYAAGTPQPLASALNFLSGQIVANTTLVPIASGSSESFALFNNSDGATHVVVDVVGYFWEYQAGDCAKVSQSQSIGAGGNAAVQAVCSAGFVPQSGGCSANTASAITWVDRRNTVNGLGYSCGAFNGSAGSVMVTTDTWCCRKAGR